jgi:hypothetical protein
MSNGAGTAFIAKIQLKYRAALHWLLPLLYAWRLGKPRPLSSTITVSWSALLL